MKLIHKTLLMATAAAALSLAAADTNTNPPARPEGHGRPVPPIIAALDANGDGIIDAVEISNAVAVLTKLDVNGDGNLSMDELRPARPEGGPGARGDREHRGGPGGPGGKRRGPGGLGGPNGGPEGHGRGHRPEANTADPQRAGPSPTRKLRPQQAWPPKLSGHASFLNINAHD